MLFRYCFLLLLVGFSASCNHTEVEPYGIQKEHIAFVPARIAVLPCQTWPVGARYYGQESTNFKAAGLKTACKNIDSFVIKGFEGQPYMRGLSPKVVSKLLTRAKQPNLLADIPKLWHQGDGDCTRCANAVSYYKKSISAREDWQQWLGKFSRSVYNADALLAPFLLYAQEGRSDDRGLAIAYKKVGMALLLIDTNNGRLIWAGGRDVQVNNRKLDTDAHLKNLKLPDWKQVSARLLVRDIWSEFPGRQNY